MIASINTYTREFTLVILSLILLGSCVSSKNTTYLQNIPDSTNALNVAISLSQYAEPKIQAGDLLQISIQTLDPQSSTMTGTTNTGNGSSSNVPAYLVDRKGNIELPLVGGITLTGLTTPEAQDAIRKKAAVYYKDPVVNIKFVNFNITVLGEVNKPSQYTLPSQRVTVLDAIGMAGDLTIFGKRENVLLIREEYGTKKFIRFNLTNSNFIESPYFYLKQNDVIYVEPNKAKVSSTQAVRDRNIGYAISIILSLISISAIFLTRL